MSGRWNRWASPISIVIVGIPSAVASPRSVPLGPSLSMITLEPKAIASRVHARASGPCRLGT